MLQNHMYEFRISKYNYAYRQNGIFMKEDWTSISDVGKVYGGKKFTYREYESVEAKYLSLIKLICNELKISHMQITDLEDYSYKCSYSNGTVLKSIDDILNVAKDCLREKYWCKLSSNSHFFHFGYDFYLYVGSTLDYTCLSELAHEVGLFVEAENSPYK